MVGPRAAPTWAGPHLVTPLNRFLVPGSCPCPSRGSWPPLWGGWWPPSALGAKEGGVPSWSLWPWPPLLLPSGGRHEERVRLSGAPAPCCHAALQTCPGRSLQEQGPVCAPDRLGARLSPELCPVGSRRPFGAARHRRTGGIRASPGPSLLQLRTQDGRPVPSRSWACLLQPRPRHRPGRLPSGGAEHGRFFLCPLRRERVWGPLD